MKLDTLNPTVILVRHAPVAERYHGVCYGRSDVELGDAGERQSDDLVEELVIWKRARIIHSGLQRTRFLAERLAERLDCLAACCPALQERDFGMWELQPWDVIHARHGDEILRMISEPDTYRPGGGETTFEMRDRVQQWFESLPNHGLTIVVTHGGPIAALLGTQRRLPVSDWVGLIPHCGQSVRIHKQQTEQG
ncbi:MAG: histidine phosphatase family protein [Planctomycetaceae bacterium]|nr:histidine phosphatase family protein [Planctomycetaceae bacterium]